MSAPDPTTHVRVDLTRFDENLRAVRARVAPAETMFVVKNDAYGHGADVLVPRAVAGGIRWIGALDIEAALHVRRIAGDDVRVFAWLLSARDDLAAADAAGLDLGVGDRAILEAAASAATARPMRVHLKIDTGLNRNGVRAEDWEAFVARAAELQNEGRIRVEGVWSHISEASDADDDEARARFDSAVAAAESAGLAPEFRHLAASAASFLRDEFRYDMVRVGAFVYGISPSGGPHESELGISPVMSLRTRVVDVRDGRAVLPLGAWHGVPSTAAGKTTVGVHGAARQVDRIERDWMTVLCPDARPGDLVVLWGPGDDGEPTATRWAEAVDTIGEEIVLKVDRRIPRLYR
ncbi:alanine racemase [Humibacter ginsenosidimutans]|uniref:Alanine racemase n=1 Tax=Humibacter ginsenosidimutans TaxID=2599293 RepID=A0A5B8M2M3_9MICO|nr:alanine racemase [Humibacter ginsenosidimutans]QDZ13880.1 alanine racemase [Humibacter ginsenosidimutans]